MSWFPSPSPDGAFIGVCRRRRQPTPCPEREEEREKEREGERGRRREIEEQTETLSQINSSVIFARTRFRARPGECFRRQQQPGARQGWRGGEGGVEAAGTRGQQTGGGGGEGRSS